MPKPLQTLLVALLEIKSDLIREKNNLQVNYETKFVNEIQSIVTKNFEIMKASAAMIKSQKKREQSLAKENFSLTGIEAEPNLQQLIIKLSQERQDYFDTFVNRKSIIIRHFDADASLKQASAAVSESENLRKRLIALAQGPLSKLFESESIEPSERPQEESIEKIEGLIKIDDEPEHLKKLAAFIRKVRYLNDAASADLVEDERNIFYDCLMSLKPKELERPEEHIKNSESLLIADRKIQAEISLVIQTLTIDRDILNNALKAIAQKCSLLKKNFDNENKNIYFHNLHEMHAKYSEGSLLLLGSWL